MRLKRDCRYCRSDRLRYPLAQPEAEIADERGNRSGTETDQQDGKLLASFSRVIDQLRVELRAADPVTERPEEKICGKEAKCNRGAHQGQRRDQQSQHDGGQGDHKEICACKIMVHKGRRERKPDQEDRRNYLPPART